MPVAEGAAWSAVLSHLSRREPAAARISFVKGGRSPRFSAAISHLSMDLPPKKWNKPSRIDRRNGEVWARQGSRTSSVVPASPSAVASASGARSHFIGVSSIWAFARTLGRRDGALRQKRAEYAFALRGLFISSWPTHSFFRRFVASTPPGSLISNSGKFRRELGAG